MARLEIRLSGAGGQGMILAGIILAEATLYEEDLNVTQTQSYGPESRGGASRAEVVISQEMIDYPKVITPDILVCLTQEALEKYSSDIKDDGVIIIDDSLVPEKLDADIRGKIKALPILKTAEEEVGLRLTANMVVLGIIEPLIPVIGRKSLIEAISKRVPASTLEMNKKAFELGQKMGRSEAGGF